MACPFKHVQMLPSSSAHLRTSLQAAQRARARQRPCQCHASTGSNVVVGVGGVGIDYLASVAAFPYPDQKMRTEALEIQGGGNCGNAMTGVARLGVSARVLSMIGTDPLGDKIMEGFEADGVSTQYLQRISDAPTPFTYIIVDKAGGTRTCIHTPGADLRPADVDPDLCRSLLTGADLVYFDGRLTEAALVVAKVAREVGIPVLVEAERLRPGLELLLAEADYIVTSNHFPQDWTGEETVGDAMLATAMRLPKFKWMVTTFGKNGSILLEREAADAADGAASAQTSTLDAVIDSLFADVRSRAHPNRDTEAAPCTSASGVPVYPGHAKATDGSVMLQFDRRASKERAKLQAALRASSREAGMGAAAPAMYNSSYSAAVPDEHGGDEQGSSGDDPVAAGSSHRQMAGRDEVLDTTGAGDAYLASLMYGLVNGKSIPEMMRLGSIVSACKCTKLGARPGLPLKSQIDEAFL